MDKYYSLFASVYPTETLQLFKKSLDHYVSNNTGREHYEFTVKLLKKMEKIEGGKEMVTNMVIDFKNKYKNRRAMIEILSKVKLFF